MSLKHLSLMIMTVALASNAFAGKNKFTVGKYETPNGGQTKVLINTNNDDYDLIVACNNKIIGEEAAHGKIMLSAQDHDVVTKTNIKNNRIYVMTRFGWEAVFVGNTIPKC